MLTHVPFDRRAWVYQRVLISRQDNWGQFGFQKRTLSMKDIHFRYPLPQEKKGNIGFSSLCRLPLPPNFQPSLLSLCLSLSPSPSLPRPYFHQTDRQAFFTPANPALLIDLHWPHTHPESGDVQTHTRRCTFTITRALGCTRTLSFLFCTFFYVLLFLFATFIHSIWSHCTCEGEPGAIPLWDFSITPANTSAHRLTAPLLLSSRLLFHAHTQYERVYVHTHACVSAWLRHVF